MVFLETTTFFGRLHPLLVHLPIGFLIIAILLSFLNSFKEKGLHSILKLVWILSFVSTLMSAFMGWLLSQNGHYIEQKLSLHQWTGFLLVLLSGLGWLFHSGILQSTKILIRSNSVLILLLLFIVGHLGGSLTHGENYLYEHAPDPIKKVFVSKTKAPLIKTPVDSVQVYEQLIFPLFEAKCIACHNQEISRGGLVMSEVSGLFKGGKSGAAIVSKNLEKSLAFNRVIRTQEDEKFMPPTGTPLSYEEIQLLEWWITAGAPLETSLAELTAPKGIQKLLLSKYALDTRPKPWFEKVELPSIPEEKLLLLEQHQFSYRALSAANNLLDIRFLGNEISEKELSVLEPIAPYITWLNLSNSKLTSEAFETIKKMENLTRLQLQQNPINTFQLSPLASLEHLEILNLHSTQVDDGVFDLVRALGSLKKVYLWNTRVTRRQLENQKSLFQTTELVGLLE